PPPSRTAPPPPARACARPRRPRAARRPRGSAPPRRGPPGRRRCGPGGRGSSRGRAPGRSGWSSEAPGLGFLHLLLLPQRGEARPLGGVVGAEPDGAELLRPHGSGQPGETGDVLAAARLPGRALALVPDAGEPLRPPAGQAAQGHRPVAPRPLL